MGIGGLRRVVEPPVGRCGRAWQRPATGLQGVAGAPWRRGPLGRGGGSASLRINGRPTVPLQQGMVFRGDNGESVALGGKLGRELDFTVASATDVARASSLSFLACVDSVAYRLDGYNHVLAEHTLGAKPRAAAIPAEAMEVAREKNGSFHRIALQLRVQQPVSGRRRSARCGNAYVGNGGGGGGQGDWLLGVAEERYPFGQPKASRDVRRQRRDPEGQVGNR